MKSHASLAVVPVTSSHEVQQMIMDLNKKFKTLKNNIRKCLEMKKVSVDEVADILTSLSPDDEIHHKMFLESHVRVFATAANHSELFGTMNFHWNYLDPSLLDHLVTELDLEKFKVEMEAYKSDLQKFRMVTPLTLFCRTQKRRKIKPPAEFQEIVAQFDWPENVTLEDVEKFRQEYASHYNLHEFAMMLAQVHLGSFIITWFIPEAIIEKLKAQFPREIVKKYFVTKLEIAGTCIYDLQVVSECVCV